jgi:hypothetical protein
VARPVKFGARAVRVPSVCGATGDLRLHGDDVNHSSDHDRLLHSTADAFTATLHALLDEDAHTARGVLRGSAPRRRLLAATQAVVREQHWAPGPQLGTELQYLADLGRVNQLVDVIARLVVTGPPALTPAHCMEVAVLLDAGSRRLRQLQDGPVGPGLDPSYRGCGGALFEVADHGGRDASAVLQLCGALALTLLQASRHAARAA